MLLAFALGILNTYLGWDRLIGAMSPFLAAPVLTILGLQIGFFSLYLLLLWLVGRKGSLIARWLFVGLVVTAVLFAFISPPPSLRDGIVPAALAIAQYLLALAAIELLFRPSAQLWFAGKSVDPEIFR
ncbi:MAG TPA: hypothetical protein VJS15_02145 [Allosphingosinicella sp.]|nr:hypothetical protein [Allosphingosinicella sp.]